MKNMDYNETPTKGPIVILNILIALIALFVGFLATRIYYKKKIVKLHRVHADAIRRNFHIDFQSGWNEGLIEGKKQGRLEIMRSRQQ